MGKMRLSVCVMIAGVMAGVGVVRAQTGPNIDEILRNEKAANERRAADAAHMKTEQDQRDAQREAEITRRVTAAAAVAATAPAPAPAQATNAAEMQAKTARIDELEAQVARLNQELARAKAATRPASSQP
jgi:hypothetical protein